MLTTAEIKALKPKGRTILFDVLCESLFSTQAEAAAALEISRRTLVSWRTDHTVPLTALLALHHMAEDKLMQNLSDIAASLQATAQLITALVKPSPSAPSGNARKPSSAARPGRGSAL